MQDIKDRVEEAIEFLNNLPKDDIFRCEIDASIRFAETVKELTEREAKLVDLIKACKDYLPERPDYNPRLGADNKLRNIYIGLKELGY